MADGQSIGKLAPAAAAQGSMMRYEELEHDRHETCEKEIP